MKKFEFTGETKLWFGRTLHRIRALISIERWNVKKGDDGGWIEKEENLTHDGNAWVSGDAWVYGDAQVCGNALVCDNARVYGNALVCGNALVYGDARVSGDARVCDNAHYMTIGPIGSRNGITTFFRDKSGKIMVMCGCFYGDIDAFIEEVKQTHRESKHAKAYLAAAELAKIQIDISEVKDDAKSE